VAVGDVGQVGQVHQFHGVVGGDDARARDQGVKP
jgi:hypothetical protein